MASIPILSNLIIDGSLSTTGLVTISKEVEALKFTTTASLGSSYISWNDGGGLKAYLGYAAEINDIFYISSQEASSINIGTNTRTTDLVIASSGAVTLAGSLTVNTLAAALTDVDRFVVADGGLFKFRTGAEVLSDIGATNNTGTVTSVSAGNGMSFTTITGSGAVTLGTPGNLSGSTTNSVSATSHTHNIQTGINNTNIVGIASSSVTAGEYAKFTSTGLESRSFAEVLSDIGAAAALSGTTNTIPKFTSATTIGNSNLTDTGLVVTSNAIFRRALGRPIVTTISTSYTLLLTISDSIVVMSAAGTKTLNIPTNAAQAIGVGTEFSIINTGAGLLTIAGAGVTLRNVSGLTIEQYDTRVLTKLAANEWVIGPASGTSFTEDKYLRSDVADTKTSGALTMADNIRFNLNTSSEFFAAGTNSYMDILTGLFYIRNNASQVRHTFDSSGNLNSVGTVTANSTLQAGVVSSQNGQINLNKSDGGQMQTAWESDYYRHRLSGTGTIAGWRWDNFDTDVMTLSNGGALTLRAAGKFGNLGTGSADTWLTLEGSGNGGAGRGSAILFNSPSSGNTVSTVKLLGLQETASGTANDASFVIQVANTSSVLTERMRIHPSGNISIGNTNDTFKLDTTGTGRFTSTVTATNFILSSDERLKENILSYEVKPISVHWKSFNWKETGDSQIGVIAQELEKEHPEFVRTDKEGMKSVAYIDLLVAKNAELENRITKLELLIKKLL